MVTNMNIDDLFADDLSNFNSTVSSLRQARQQHQQQSRKQTSRDVLVPQSRQRVISDSLSTPVSRKGADQAVVTKGRRAVPLDKFADTNAAVPSTTSPPGSFPGQDLSSTRTTVVGRTIAAANVPAWMSTSDATEDDIVASSPPAANSRSNTTAHSITLTSTNIINGEERFGRRGTPAAPTSVAPSAVAAFPPDVFVSSRPAARAEDKNRHDSDDDDPFGFLEHPRSTRTRNTFSDTNNKDDINHSDDKTNNYMHSDVVSGIGNSNNDADPGDDEDDIMALAQRRARALAEAAAAEQRDREVTEKQELRTGIAALDAELAELDRTLQSHQQQEETALSELASQMKTKQAELIRAYDSTHEKRAQIQSELAQELAKLEQRTEQDVEAKEKEVRSAEVTRYTAELQSLTQRSEAVQQSVLVLREQCSLLQTSQPFAASSVHMTLLEAWEKRANHTRGANFDHTRSEANWDDKHIEPTVKTRDATTTTTTTTTHNQKVNTTRSAEGENALGRAGLTRTGVDTDVQSADRLEHMLSVAEQVIQAYCDAHIQSIRAHVRQDIRAATQTATTRAERSRAARWLQDALAYKTALATHTQTMWQLYHDFVHDRVQSTHRTRQAMQTRARDEAQALRSQTRTQLDHLLREAIAAAQQASLTSQHEMEEMRGRVRSQWESVIQEEMAAMEQELADMHRIHRAEWALQQQSRKDELAELQRQLKEAATTEEAESERAFAELVEYANSVCGRALAPVRERLMTMAVMSELSVVSPAPNTNNVDAESNSKIGHDGNSANYKIVEDHASSGNESKTSPLHVLRSRSGSREDGHARTDDILADVAVASSEMRCAELERAADVQTKRLGELFDELNRTNREIEQQFNDIAEVCERDLVQRMRQNRTAQMARQSAIDFTRDTWEKEHVLQLSAEFTLELPVCGAPTTSMLHALSTTGDDVLHTDVPNDKDNSCKVEDQDEMSPVDADRVHTCSASLSAAHSVRPPPLPVEQAQRTDAGAAGSKPRAQSRHDSNCTAYDIDSNSNSRNHRNNMHIDCGDDLFSTQPAPFVRATLATHAPPALATLTAMLEYIVHALTQRDARHAALQQGYARRSAAQVKYLHELHQQCVALQHKWNELLYELQKVHRREKELWAVEAAVQSGWVQMTCEQDALEDQRRALEREMVELQAQSEACGEEHAKIQSAYEEHQRVMRETAESQLAVAVLQQQQQQKQMQARHSGNDEKDSTSNNTRNNNKSNETGDTLPKRTKLLSVPREPDLAHESQEQWPTATELAEKSFRYDKRTRGEKVTTGAREHSVPPAEGAGTYMSPPAQRRRHVDVDHTYRARTHRKDRYSDDDDRSRVSHDHSDNDEKGDARKSKSSHRRHGQSRYNRTTVSGGAAEMTRSPDHSDSTREGQHTADAMTLTPTIDEDTAVERTRRSLSGRDNTAAARDTHPSSSTRHAKQAPPVRALLHLRPPPHMSPAQARRTTSNMAPSREDETGDSAEHDMTSTNSVQSDVSTLSCSSIYRTSPFTELLALADTPLSSFTALSH